MNILHVMLKADSLWLTFFAVAAPGKGGLLNHFFPHITIPPILRPLISFAKAHPGYLVAFLLLMALGILIGIIIGVKKGREKRLRHLALFKPVAKIAASDLGIKNYLGKGSYLRRQSDEALTNLLEEGASAVLILGRPGSGKTRTVFEALRAKEDHYLLAPKPRLTSLKELTVPGLSKKKLILFLDDLYRYVNKTDVVGLFRQLEGRAKGFVFIATCAPDKLPFLEKEAPEFLRLFKAKKRIFLRDLSPAEQKFFIEVLGFNEQIFATSLTPAYFALNLANMKERYKGSENIRAIIHSLFLLHKAFIFHCEESLVKEACEQVLGKHFSRSQWRDALRDLEAMSLTVKVDSTLESYERYMDEAFVDDYTPSERDIDTLQDAILKSKDGEALFGLGTYRITNGQWEKALPVLERAIEVNPHSSEARYSLGKAYEHMGMMERALEAYKHVVKLDSHNPAAHYALGTIYNEMYMVKEAVEAFKHTILLDPYHSRAYFQLAMAYEKAGMIEECLTMLRQVTRLDPDFSEARRYLANLYQKRGQYGEALQEYRELVRINPDDEEAHLVLATAFNKIGRVNEAMNELKELIRINPANLKAHSTLALAYYRKGMLEEAIKGFKDVLILNPDDLAARSNLALAYLKRNLLDEAVEEYREILIRKPEDVAARFNIAQAYEKQDRKEEAVEGYKEVLKHNPEHAEAHYRLAIINLKDGLLEEALKELKEVVRLRPTHAMAHGQLAMIYQKAGLLAEARKEYRSYERLRPAKTKGS